MPKKVSRRKTSIKPKQSTTAATMLKTKGLNDDELRSVAASILARRRMEMISREDLEEWGRRGGKNAWAKLSPAERTIEQKRRAMVAKRNRRKKLRQRTGLE